MIFWKDSKNISMNYKMGYLEKPTMMTNLHLTTADGRIVTVSTLSDDLY